MTLAELVTPTELAWAWRVEPALAATLALAIVVYARGRARLRQRIARPDGRRRAIAFYTGLVVVAGALMSPLDALSSALFSAHMVQHLLLMLVAAPLLVYARPVAALVAGLPTGGRGAARRTRTGLSRLSAHALHNPLVVWTVGTLVLWAWHMPSPYEAAVTNDLLHILEHTTFLGAAVLFWDIVFASGARRGVPRPIATVLVFATGVQSSALGAVLLFASNPLYPVHAEGARVWEVSPLRDQQLAGALMWGPPAILYIAVMAYLLFRFFADMEDAAPDPLLATAGGKA